MLEKLRLPSLVIGLALCTAAAADELVGKMGDVELRSTELKAIINEQPADVRHQLASEPAALERLVRSELMRKAVLSEAKQKGWDKRAELQPIIERARDQVIVSSFVGNVAKPGADFGKLAKENSAHKESADKGGELGWISEEQMVPEVRKVVTGMNKGDVSQPVKSAAGWHVIKLLDKKPAATRPLADIRANLVVAMRNRKSQEMERAYLEALSIKLPPTLNQIELGKVQGELR